MLTKEHERLRFCSLVRRFLSWIGEYGLGQILSNEGLLYIRDPAMVLDTMGVEDVEFDASVHLHTRENKSY